MLPTHYFHLYLQHQLKPDAVSLCHRTNHLSALFCSQKTLSISFYTLFFFEFLKPLIFMTSCIFSNVLHSIAMDNLILLLPHILTCSLIPQKRNSKWRITQEWKNLITFCPTKIKRRIMKTVLKLMADDLSVTDAGIFSMWIAWLMLLAGY